MLTAARTEGIVLDPVYTGRAMAGLIAAVREGDVRPGERTVLLHTGGLPGLFGHPGALAQASSLVDAQSERWSGGAGVTTGPKNATLLRNSRPVVYSGSDPPGY